MTNIITRYFSAVSDLRRLRTAGVRFFPLAQAPLAIRRECRQLANTDSRTMPAGQPSIVVVVPKGAMLDFRLEGNFSGFFPAVCYLVEPKSQITFIDNLVMKNPAERVTRIVVRQNSTCDYFTSQAGALTHKTRYAALAESGASVNFAGYFDYQNEAATQISIQLRGNNSAGNIHLALRCSGHSRSVLELHNSHLGCQTTGQAHLKAIVRDRAALNAPGWITVGPKAKKTNSFLREDVLLLSPDAQAKAVPNLEILHHDVRASHSATVGQLPPRHLYYCMARGLNAAQAERLLVTGYMAELAHQVKRDRLKQLLLESINRFL